MRTIPLDEILADLPEDTQKRIKERAAELTAELKYNEAKKGIEDIAGYAAHRVGDYLHNMRISVGDLIFRHLQDVSGDVNATCLELAKLAEDTYKQNLDITDLFSDIIDYVRGRIDNTDTNLRLDSTGTIHRVEK